MFDLTHGLIFAIGSMTLIISILVIFNYLVNTFKKEEKELNEIQERELNKTIKKIEGLAQTKNFLTRSSELNCNEEELEKIACLSYQGLSQKARGDITREYLRPYFEACS